MHNFDTMRVLWLYERLQAMEGGYIQLREKSGGGVFPARQEFMELLVLLDSAQKVGEIHGLPKSAHAAKAARAHLTETGAAREVSACEAHLRTVRDAVFTETRDLRYFRVASDRTEYLSTNDKWEKVFVFGDAVLAAFPKCEEDARDAGDCLAAELPTAAVFHLMRVAEFGIRALAHDRRITVLANDKPIDLGSWEGVLKELEKAERAIEGFPKTHAREAQYEFYHGAMMELKRFKNVFRNRVMHTRESFDRDQAKSVYTHVRAFMTILASRISERKRTPLIWVGAKWLKS